MVTYTNVDELSGGKARLVSQLTGEVTVRSAAALVTLTARLPTDALYEQLRDRWQETDIASLTFRHEEDLLATARDRERAYMEVIMPMKLELALQGRSGGSKLREDGKFTVVMRLVSLRREDRAMLEWGSGQGSIA